MQAPGRRYDAGANQLPGESITTTSGPDGRFEFSSLDPARTGLTLEASTADAATEKPFEVSPALRTPVTLTIHSGNLVALSGRVLNRSGQPVQGVELELWSQEHEYSQPERPILPGSSLRSNAEGRFATPRQFRVDHRYKVKAGGPGLFANWSDWMRFQPGKPATVPHMVVDRPRLATGRVVDTKGQPIGGAEVWIVSEYPDRPRTTAREDGSFRVGLPPGGVILIFTEARGFRFQGRLVDPSASDLELTLRRTNEAPAELAGAPGSLSDAGRTASAGAAGARAGDPDARTGTCGVAEYQTLQRLARIDPARALEIAEKAKFVEPMMRDGIKAEAAQALLKESPDEALALIESLADATGRVHAYCRAIDLLPASEKVKEAPALDAVPGQCPCHQGAGTPPYLREPDCRSPDGSRRDRAGDQDAARGSEGCRRALHIGPRRLRPWCLRGRTVQD